MPFLLFVTLLSEGGIILEENFSLSLLFEVFQVVELSV